MTQPDLPMTDRTYVQDQYAGEGNLATRSAVWQPGEDGRDPSTEALALLVEDDPDTVLEIGCGTGAFAARLAAALPGTDVVATDQSDRMVELAAARGLTAQVADARPRTTSLLTCQAPPSRSAGSSSEMSWMFDVVPTPWASA